MKIGDPECIGEVDTGPCTVRHAADSRLHGDALLSGASEEAIALLAATKRDGIVEDGGRALVDAFLGKPFEGVTRKRHTKVIDSELLPGTKSLALFDGLLVPLSSAVLLFFL